MLYGYPTNARPFYTMLDPKDPNYTNSYDFFMRGEEVLSGSQRVHEHALLEKQAKEKGIGMILCTLSNSQTQKLSLII